MHNTRECGGVCVHTILLYTRVCFDLIVFGLERGCIFLGEWARCWAGWVVLEAGRRWGCKLLISFRLLSIAGLAHVWVQFTPFGARALSRFYCKLIQSNFCALQTVDLPPRPLRRRRRAEPVATAYQRRPPARVPSSPAAAEHIEQMLAFHNEHISSKWCDICLYVLKKLRAWVGVGVLWVGIMCVCVWM